MKRFCFINYNEHMCHPYFIYADNVESVYQYMFDNEMIDFNYEGVDKNEYTIKDIYTLFEKSQSDINVKFRSMIIDFPTHLGSVVPKQIIRWNKNSSKPVTVNYEKLELSRQKELDLTVDIVRALEQKRNVFQKLKELKELDNRLNKFAINRKNLKKKRDE